MWRGQCNDLSNGSAKWSHNLPSCEGTLNADKYIDLLRISAVPIMKLNYGDDFFFQEDNSPVHKARKVQNFLISSGINTMASEESRLEHC